MADKLIVITGASDGLGAAAARHLAAKGEKVVLVGRSPEKTRALANQLKAPYYLADYADLEQVKVLAAELKKDFPRIDVLVNNAGGIMGNREITKDGFEKTFQVNHLAQFLLTYSLLPVLTTSKATVIQTASIAAKRFGNIDIDDLQNEKRYSPGKAYGDAKLANILFTRELQNRYGEQGLSAAAYHPGIVGTSFASNTTHFMRYLYHTPLLKHLFTISPNKGIATLLWLIEGKPGIDWRQGGYYEKFKLGKTSTQADDPELARQLWEKSKHLLNLS